MPNHLHGILIFTEPASPDGGGGAASSAPTDSDDEPILVTKKATLGNVIRGFKSLSAIAANRLLDRATQPFWQRNYYERIIRDDKEMEYIRTYIRSNPQRWATDVENPEAISGSGETLGKDLMKVWRRCRPYTPKLIKFSVD